MNAVDAEGSELLDDARVGVAVVTEREAVEMRIAVDDVDAEHLGLFEVTLHQRVELSELLRDSWVAQPGTSP